mgnify:CR=1 FL=1
MEYLRNDTIIKNKKVIKALRIIFICGVFIVLIPKDVFVKLYLLVSLQSLNLGMSSVGEAIMKIWTSKILKRN